MTNLLTQSYNGCLVIINSIISRLQLFFNSKSLKRNQLDEIDGAEQEDTQFEGFEDGVNA